MKAYPRPLKIWLIIGLVMVFFQVIIGGVTRLTGSGLSITKWEIVTGTLPPLNAAAWEEAFDLYKATPQYQHINEGMSMGEFQFIYFWEYFHRLWARSMGFVFLVPFIIFASRGWIDRKLAGRLGVVVLMASLAAAMGWIMVASGLIKRPWVNAYKLALHLCIALLVFASLLWASLEVFFPARKIRFRKAFSGRAFWIVVLLFVQVFLGGIMSGMKAGLFFPTWPDMYGEYLPSMLRDGSSWTYENMVHYDSHPFMAGLVQFLHRNMAYLLAILVSILCYRVLAAERESHIRQAARWLLALLGLQITLGIITVLNCVGHIPVFWGVMHQAGAILLFAAGLAFYFLLSRRGPVAADQ